jgi:hypothetical protein
MQSGRINLWIGDFPLSSRFVRLFQISADPQGLVSQFYRDGRWNIRFRRSFGLEEQDSWAELLDELREVHISDSDDSVSWNLEPSGTFSTKSLYQRMIQGASVAHAKDVWKAACPLKVRILIWQLARDRLPLNVQIKRHHGNSDGNCALYHVPEDAAHIFFNCPLAQFAWSCCRELLQVDWNPSSFADLFAVFQCFTGVSKRFLWILFAAQSWTLWTIRNKFSIEAKFPKHPANIVFKTAIFLQLWRGIYAMN